MNGIGYMVALSGVCICVIAFYSLFSYHGVQGTVGVWMVNDQESRSQFQRADVLFRGGDFAGALAVLRELDVAHPNTRNILVPLAMCLERLGQFDEALVLAERLARQFADRRARELAQRLRLPRAAPAIAVDSLIDDLDYVTGYALPDLGPVTVVPVPEQSDDEPSRWPMFLLYGFCLLMIVGLLLLPLVRDGGYTEAQVSEESRVSPEQAGFFVGVLLLGFCYSLAAGTLSGMLALGVLGKLPSNSLSGVVLDVGGTILIVNLISLVLGLIVAQANSPGIGMLSALAQVSILLYLFKRYYDLGWGNLAGFFFVYFILSCVLLVLPLLAFVGVAGIVAFFAG